MASWLVIAGIVISSWVLGGLLVFQFHPNRQKLNLELLFAALIIGLTITGWLALVLAEFGVYSIRSLLVVWSIFLIMLSGLAFYRARRPQALNDEALSLIPDEPDLASKRWARIEPVILIFWLITAGWLFFRPHEYILGGADAGVYVSLGAEIAQHGSFAIRDESLATLPVELHEAVLRPLPTNPIAPSYLLPGFYVQDARAGTVTPQFYPLHPVWQAVAFSLSGSTVAGIRAELLMTGLWMTLAILAIYFQGREIMGFGPALLVLAALSITALQVWFARYPTTEALTQFHLWAGLWGLAMWFGNHKPSSLWAFLSGISFGALFLVRIDVLILLPIFMLLIGILWIRGWRRSDWWFAVPFVLLVGQSAAHGLWLSAPYFYEHIGYGLRLLLVNWWIIAVLVFAGLIFLWAVRKYQGRLMALMRVKKPLAGFIIALVLLFALYGWFIRPVTGSARFYPDAYSETILVLANHENWLRLGWYLSPIGIWLGVAGSCLMIWRIERRTAVLLAIGLLFSAVYLWDVRANPHHVYVMRRFVPAVVPFFILSAAYLLGFLGQRLFPRMRNSPRIADYAWSTTIIVLIGLWLAGLGWSARGFISQVDNVGVVEQLAEINGTLDPHSILIFNDQSPVGLGDFWGTPLKYLFGHDVFILRDLEALSAEQLAQMIEVWQNNGRSVIWIGEPAWLSMHGFLFHEELWTISSRRLESSYEYKPQAVVPVTWTLPMAFVE